MRRKEIKNVFVLFFSFSFSFNVIFFLVVKVRERRRERNRETGGKCGKAEVRRLVFVFGFVREREKKRDERRKSESWVS